MKIVFFVRDLGLGGVERCVALVAEGLAARGFDVTVALLGGNCNLWEKHTAGVRVASLAQCWHGRKPWTWPAGWRAARRLVSDADVVIAATFLMPLYMAWAATRGLNKRLIAWVHGPKAELDAFARMNPIHRTACQFIYRRVREIVCVSEHARDSLARWLGKSVPAGWRVMPNFVEPMTPRAVRQPGSPLELLFVGRIAVEKQPHLWLDTLQALARRGIAARLTVVGDGPLQDWLAGEAGRRGLSESLVLAGRRDDVADFLRAADLLLLTSSFEGCPLVVLEAMQAGLPVVSTNAGGVYELFADRRDDFIAAQASGEALAATIAAQLPRYAELVEWERRRAQDYAPDALLDKWADLAKSSY